MSFRPISKESRHIGKVVKASKRRESWVFEFKGRTYKVDYFASWRGKRKLMVDGGVYPAVIRKGQVCECQFELAGETMEISINMVGSNLYVGEKCFEVEFRERYESILPPLPEPTVPIAPPKPSKTLQSHKSLNRLPKLQDTDLISFDPVPLTTRNTNIPSSWQTQDWSYGAKTSRW